MNFTKISENSYEFPASECEQFFISTNCFKMFKMTDEETFVNSFDFPAYAGISSQGRIWK